MVVPAEGWADEIDVVGVKESAEALEAEGFVDGGIAVVFCDVAEELFDFVGGLVNVDDFARVGAGAGPDVGDGAGDEDGFAGAEVELLFGEVEFEFAVDDVEPFVLVAVGVFRAAGVAVEFEDGEGVVGVFGGEFAVDGFTGGAAEFEVLTEAVVAWGDSESVEEFFAFHFLFSFQMLERFVDGFDQVLRVGEFFLEDFAV